MKKLVLFLCLLFVSCNKEKTSKIKTTVLKGEVIDRNTSKFLLLIDKKGDFRIKNIQIPIINGKFSHIIKSKFIQEYQLAFKDEIDNGSWRRIDFFNDKDTITFKLFSKKEEDNHKVYGGILNSEKEKYKKETHCLFWDKVYTIQNTKIDSLEKIKKWETKEVQDIWKKIDAEKDNKKNRKLLEKYWNLKKNNKHLTPQGLFWKAKIDSIIKKYYQWDTNKVKTDNSLLGFSMLMDKLYRNQQDKTFNIMEVETVFKKYKKLFPKHPYILVAENILKGIKNSKVEGFYTDFQSKQSNDKLTNVSEIIKNNNLTLIDLWAPWCGPCIEKSMKLKKEYKNLKDKGLEIFAVVGGIDKKEKYLKARDKYHYPWKVNYELNEEFNIWAKYNISRSGGSQFLINAKGKILAINPEPKEIDSILNSLTLLKL